MPSLETLIARLKSPKESTRYEACEHFRVAPSLTPEASAALLTATNDPSDQVADAAVRALEAHSPAAPKPFPAKAAATLELTQDDIVHSAATRRYSQYLVVSAGLILLVVVLNSRQYQGYVPIIMLLLVLFTRLNWRCPKCGASLGRGRDPKTCLRCGAILKRDYVADISKLIMDLQSQSTSKRYDAAEQLRVLPQIPREAIEALQHAAKHPEPSSSEAARRALAIHAPAYQNDPW